jgi:hypothetical protein
MCASSGLSEKSEVADVVGYSKRTSTSACLYGRSTLSGSGGVFMFAIAAPKLTKERSFGSTTLALRMRSPVTGLSFSNKCR